MDEDDDLLASMEALAELEPGQAGGDRMMQAFEGPALKRPAMSASLAPADQTEVTADRYRLNGQSRLRWSAHLHALFQACVQQLGGPAAATPAAIQRLVRLQSMPTARANPCCWCCCSTATTKVLLCCPPTALHMSDGGARAVHRPHQEPPAALPPPKQRTRPCSQVGWVYRTCGSPACFQSAFPKGNLLPP